jgi:hypothetical protein
VSLFNYAATYDDGDGAYFHEIEVEDSETIPGALVIACTEPHDKEAATYIDLPREQVEKLYAVLGRWLNS